MRPTFRTFALLSAGLGTLGALLCFSWAGPVHGPPAPAGEEVKPVAGFWNVDDLRPGMKGYGKTVMKGTKVETFQVEVLGVLKHTSPGRDMVLCRLSGLDLERTGIIAGMSGSPIYIKDKLVGAVAYGWAYGKDPIGGITPYSQMQGFAESFERSDRAEKRDGKKVGTRHALPVPVAAGDKLFDSVTVSQSVAGGDEEKDDGLWLRPLATPLVASGMSENSLKLLKGQTKDLGLVPLQGGAAGTKVAEEARDVALEAGGPLSVAMIRGDFDLSGIGTVTHIDGDRVYGWGHPFMSLGGCEFPLMTGWIHTIYPRQSVSFKMGSPLRTVGVINADVSTCIAGWLGREPDMMSMKINVQNGPNGAPRTFNVETVRQKSMLASLVYTALTNCIDMEGDLPDELTADFEARIEIEGGEPLVIKDTFSGFSGGRTPSALYSQVASAVGILTNNPYKAVRIARIECTTRIRPGRISAEIENIEPVSEVYEPGETVKVHVHLRPWKGRVEKVTVGLKLPADLPEGSYTATVGDDLTAVRAEMRDSPALSGPQTLPQVMEAVRTLLKARRTSLAVRLPVGTTGLSVDGKELPNLPESMVAVLGGGRKGGSQPIRGAVVERHPTPWVVLGQETVTFKVTRNKKVSTMTP